MVLYTYSKQEIRHHFTEPCVCQTLNTTSLSYGCFTHIQTKHVAPEPPALHLWWGFNSIVGNITLPNSLLPNNVTEVKFLGKASNNWTRPISQPRLPAPPAARLAAGGGSPARGTLLAFGLILAFQGSSRALVLRRAGQLGVAAPRPAGT